MNINNINNKNIKQLGEITLMIRILNGWVRAQVCAGAGIWKNSENLSSSGNRITTCVEFFKFLR